MTFAPPRLKQVRDSSIELLRILAMFLIVCHHFAVHGGARLSGLTSFSSNTFTTQVLACGGKIGVILFVLITGYFLVKSVLKPSSLLYLFLTVVFYQLFLYLLLRFGFHRNINFSLTQILLPIKSNAYWFISAYFILCFLSPFINKALLNMRQEQSLLLLCIFGSLWFIAPIFSKHGEYYSSTLLLFVYYYCCGAFIRLNWENKQIPSRYLVAGLLIGIVGIIAGILFSYWYPKDGYMRNWFFWANLESPLALLISVTLFILFKQMNIGYKAWINSIAACMLGVYLIHDNNYVRPWLWKVLCHIPEKISHPGTLRYIGWSLFVISTVFVTCTLIEFVRNKVSRQLYNQYVMPRIKSCDQWTKSFFS